MKKTILFDIDYTLIDTNKLRSLIIDQLAKLTHSNREKIESLEKKYFLTLSHRHDFDPDEYTQFLADHFGLQQNVLAKAFFEEQNTHSKSLYPDSIQILEKLSKDYQLGIFSEGFLKFQTSKITHSGISHFFDPKLTFIFRRKLKPENLVKLPKQITIIDDNPKVIQKLLTQPDINIIWLNRNNKQDKLDVTTITTLNKLQPSCVFAE